METSKLVVLMLFVYCFCSFIRSSQELPPGCSEQSLFGENGLNLPNSSYTASSFYKAKHDKNDSRYLPHAAKLHGSHGWATKTNDDPNDYLQIDLGSQRVITAVATQGTGTKIHEWVKKYQLILTNGSSTNCTYHKSFQGNNDFSTVIRRTLPKPIKAQYIRFIPLSQQGHKVMRVDVYVIGQGPPTVTSTPSGRSMNLTWTIKPCYTTNFITGFTLKFDQNMYHVKGNRSTSYYLKNLKPDTGYAISVRAITNQGPGVWTTRKIIKTSIEAPEAPPVTNAKAISSTSLRINWTKPAKINGPLKGYKIFYKTRGNATTVDVLGDITSFILKSLLKYTTYSIRIAVMNTNFIGPRSKDVVISTMEDEIIPRGMTRDLKWENITPKPMRSIDGDRAPCAPRNVNGMLIPARGTVRPRVVITWDIPRKLNGILQGYTIEYWYNNMDVSKKKTIDKTSPLKYTVTIMYSGTFYYKIRAYTISPGPYATGRPISIVYNNCPERSLFGRNSLHVPNSSYSARSTYNQHHEPSSAKLHSKHGWAPKCNTNPDDYLQIDLGAEQVIIAVATQGSGSNREWVKKYILHFANYTSQFGSSAGIELTGNIDHQSVVRHDLENPMTAQYVRFVPLGYHRRKTMRVNVHVTYQYVHITMVIPSKRSISLGWTVKPCFPTHPIKEYEIRRETKAEKYTVHSTRTMYNLTNLEPYTEYNVSVRAIKQVGYGVWTNTTTTTTHMAEPEVSPYIYYIEATTSTTITIKWKLLHPELIHGPFEGYKITYRPDGRDTKTTVAGRITSYTLTSLLKYKRYFITVAVKNTNYIGTPSTRWATTKIDRPRKAPFVTRLIAKSSESIFLKWTKLGEDDINGPLVGYEIKCTPEGGQTMTVNLGVVTEHTLTSLLKYTTYRVTIAAKNSKYTGPANTAAGLRVTTLEDAPSAPVNVNGTLIAGYGSDIPRVTITWDEPRDLNGIIRKYTIVYYYNMDTSNKKIVTINATCDLTYTLNVTEKYGIFSFKISATTIKEGPFQSGNKITLPYRGKGNAGRNTHSESVKSGTVAGLVIGIILVALFLVLAYLIWKRKYHQEEFKYEADVEEPLPLHYLEDTRPSLSANNNDVNEFEDTATILRLVTNAAMERSRENRSSFRTASLKSVKRSIDRTPSTKPVKRSVEFPAPDINKLKREFQSIPVEPRFDYKEGKKPANKVKNRYKNIIAYDHSLVALEWVYGDTESFYINASYIHGYDGTTEVYIATQGPMENTFNDFWRMVWEQKISSIIMLTKLRELGRVKCHQYWPKDCHQYSDITVTTHKTEVFADFVIRTFFISKAGSPTRRVRQFHFTAWPDKGVPEHATAVLGFRRKVLTLSSDDDSPSVVHCSAGVGRTGTYIMIDAMLRQAEEQQRVDILSYLNIIRNDRPYMVQTEEQYIFVNMAVHESLTCGNTEIPVENLSYAIQQLSSVDRRNKLTGYALEFQLLEDVTSRDTQEASFNVGRARQNIKKNRYSHIIAANASRVVLSTDSDTEIGDYVNSSAVEAYKERKGDYINASFVDTYRERKAFIMTQAPMENTIVDFWRMVMDYKIGTIVMLNNLEDDDEAFPQYWPLHGTKTYGSTKVELLESKHCAGNTVLRVFGVSNRKKALTVSHFQHLTWENKCIPTNPQSVLNLLNRVQKSQQKSGNSPIIVQCSNGVGRSGTFCAIASCLERVKQEQVLDVFQTVKSIRVNRPGAVETLSQYVFCYNVIQKYLDSFRDYANFGDV